MKYFILSILCLGLFRPAICQKPEKIYGNARQSRSIAYYKEQAVAWKKEVDKNPKDANAWYNYYYVNRNLMFNDTLDTRSPEEVYAAVKKIVDEMERNIPGSYEFNICKWQVNAFDRKYLPYLKKAAELGPARTEHLDYMINQGELERNIADRDLYSKKKFDAGQFSTGIVYYNYNVLMGLEPKAILFTGGDNDTYPIWWLQSQGIRKDVTVINLSLIQIDYYRDKLFAELGVEAWPKPAGGMQTSVEYEHFQNGIIRHVASNTKKLPVYAALTVGCNGKYTQIVEDKLYLTGLAYLYSERSIDNIAVMKRNVEQLYALDYLDKAFYNEISPDMVKIINGNYIVPLMHLYDHYKLAGDNQRGEWVKAKLIAVSKGTEHESEILKRVAAGY
jgi:hypothetical protein